jgi:ABC-type dipeptide/oligopeptide/nickel transport system permease subunit
MEKATNELTIEDSIKDYILRRLKSPYFIAGLVIIFLFILICIAPMAFTAYTYTEVFTVQAGAWNPPSPAHPLGQTELGFDVAGAIVYSIPVSLIIGFFAVLIGLGGGILFGFLAGRFNQIVDNIIMAGLISFYILPTIVIIIIQIAIFGPNYHPGIMIVVFGAILTPSFTRVIADEVARNLNIKNILKAVLPYIPLYFGIAILVNEALGFLGLTNPLIRTLGGLINQARVQLYAAPWASLFPGLTILGMVLSFFLLYIGLQDHGPTGKTPFKFKFRRSDEREESVEYVSE